MAVESRVLDLLLQVVGVFKVIEAIVNSVDSVDISFSFLLDLRVCLLVDASDGSILVHHKLHTLLITKVLQILRRHS